MKKVFLLFSLIVNQLQAQTTLSEGDIAVIGFKTYTNTDAGNDAIKLVNLVDLECNTTFIITDNNWRNSSPIGWACDEDEFGLLITCNTTISAGSIFYIDVSAAGGTAVCSGGTITKTAIGNPWGTDYGLSSGGDAQIAWFKCTDANTPPEEKLKWEKKLKKYCAQDTLAMYDFIRYLEQDIQKFANL